MEERGETQSSNQHLSLPADQIAVVNEGPIISREQEDFIKVRREKVLYPQFGIVIHSIQKDHI